MKLVKNVAGAEDSGIVIVFHDLNLAFRYADRILLLNDRAVHNTGCPRDVLTEDVIKDVYGVRAKIIDTETARSSWPRIPADTLLLWS